MNWIELRALHQLFENGEVPQNQTLSGSDEIRFLINSLQLLDSSPKRIMALDGYKPFYEQNYEEKFLRYQKFLSENNLLKPQTRFELKDIDVLIGAKEGMDSGDLNSLRDQIIAADESLRGISLMFFRHEKYLLNKPSLVEALKLVLQVEYFSNEKDQQYIYKLECNSPKVIVLCENLDFLTKPNKPRMFGIELWYAGGRNIQKLHYTDTRGLPIYYSCDWDLDGLQIYGLVKNIIPPISLLYPTGTPRDIQATEHNSIWDSACEFSGLSTDLFSKEQIQLIQQLIKENTWIIEESNDLILMLMKAGMIVN